MCNVGTCKCVAKWKKGSGMRSAFHSLYIEQAYDGDEDGDETLSLCHTFWVYVYFYNVLVISKGI